MDTNMSLVHLVTPSTTDKFASCLKVLILSKSSWQGNGQMPFFVIRIKEN